MEYVLRFISNGTKCKHHYEVIDINSVGFRFQCSSWKLLWLLEY